jgi:predicted RNA binding protein YcfA (HicA-like mRNA interferase family)
MPKLPIITSSKLIRALKKLGFYEHHQVGSHLQLKHSDGRRTTVAVHQGKDIPRKTMNLRPASWSVSEEETFGTPSDK